MSSSFYSHSPPPIQMGAPVEEPPADKGLAHHEQDNQPLLAPTIMVAQPQQPQPWAAMPQPIFIVQQTQRTWRGNICQCFGEGTPDDMVACCLASNSQCIAFGLNSHRALRLPFWREALRFFVVSVVAYVMYSLSYSLYFGGCTAAEIDSYFDDADFDDGTCKGLLAFFIISTIISTGLVVALVVYAAKRRQRIREQFGIAGTLLSDCCLWLWCAPCVMCQETRTLMHNKVEAGVWHGADAVTTSAAQAHQGPAGLTAGGYPVAPHYATYYSAVPSGQQMV